MSEVADYSLSSPDEFMVEQTNSRSVKRKSEEGRVNSEKDKKRIRNAAHTETGGKQTHTKQSKLDVITICCKQKKNINVTDVPGKSTIRAKLTKSERNRLYYEQNKDKIEQHHIRKKIKAEKNSVHVASMNAKQATDLCKIGVQPSTSSAKLTKSERNKLYYEKNKERIRQKKAERDKSMTSSTDVAIQNSKNKKRISTELSAEEAVGYIKRKRDTTGAGKLTKAEINRKYYEKNKDRIKEARMRKYYEPVNHAAELAKRKAAYRDPVKHAAELAKARAAYAVPEKRMAKLAVKKKAYSDPVKHAAHLAKGRAAYAQPEKHMAKLTAKKKAYRDPVRHAAELGRKKAAYAVLKNRRAKLVQERKFRQNPVNRALILAQRRILYQNQKIQGTKKAKTSKKSKNSDYDYFLSKARKAMMEMPVLACTVCHRARFKEQVKLCHRNKYPQSELVLKCFTGKYIHKCSTDCTDSSVYHDKKKKEWVCFTCHRHLLKGNMPPQAAVNNLWLDDIPEELKALNALEMHLVSIVQPFMKVVPLPRGGQKGVRGQMVCVPANLQRTADSLPWTLNTNNLIRVKLKRKQQYKGHHLYMVVNQERVMSALRKLMEINPAYKGKLYNL